MARTSETASKVPGVEPEGSPESSADEPRWGGRRIAGAIGGGLGVLIFVTFLVVGLANSGGESSIGDALADGERPPAPEIELPVLFAGDGVGPQGERVSLSDLRGRTVVLNFWASWCGPCRDEAPLLEGISRRYRDRDVLVLGVDTQDLSDNALGFIRQLGLSYPSLRDGTDGAQRRFQVTGLPETFILDASGRIAFHHIGPVTNPEQITTPLDQTL